MKKNLLLMCVAIAIANQVNANIEEVKNKVGFDILVMDTTNNSQNILNQSQIETENNHSAKIVCQSSQAKILKYLKLKVTPKINSNNNLNLSVDLKLKNSSGTFTTSKSFKNIESDKTITITKDDDGSEKNLVMFITPHIK